MKQALKSLTWGIACGFIILGTLSSCKKSQSAAAEQAEKTQSALIGTWKLTKKGKVAVSEGVVQDDKKNKEEIGGKTLTAKTIEFKDDNTYIATYIESQDPFWVHSVGATTEEEAKVKTKIFSGKYSVENGGTAIILSSPDFVTSLATKWVGLIGTIKNVQQFATIGAEQAGKNVKELDVKDLVARVVLVTPQVSALSHLFSGNQEQIIQTIGAIAGTLANNDQVKQALEAAAKELKNGATTTQTTETNKVEEELKQLVEQLKQGVTSFEDLAEKVSAADKVHAVGAILKALKNSASAQNNLRILRSEVLTEFQKDESQVFVDEAYAMDLQQDTALVLHATNRRFLIFDTSVNNVGVKNETFTFTKQ